MNCARALAAILMAAGMTGIVAGCRAAAPAEAGGKPAAGGASDGAGTHAAAGTVVVGRAIPASGWDRPGDQAGRVRAAGLDLLATEALTVHYHAHLDVLVDGVHVTVPGGLGISVPDSAGGVAGMQAPGAAGIAALHTHDTSGVLHVESPVNHRFTLGQVFTEWDVALAAGQVGVYRNGGGKTVGVFVDGKRWTGDPASVVLRPHEEIAIVVSTPGTSPASPPSSYPFPAGL